MELKKWDEYSFLEQKELLMHWWHYYGKSMYSLADLEKYEKIIEFKTKKVFEFVVATYILEKPGQSILLSAIKNNIVDELFQTLPQVENEDQKFQMEYHQAEEKLISILVNSYNNPKPAIPLTPEEFIEQITSLMNEGKHFTKHN